MQVQLGDAEPSVLGLAAMEVSVGELPKMPSGNEGRALGVGDSKL